MSTSIASDMLLNRAVKDIAAQSAMMDRGPGEAASHKPLKLVAEADGADTGPRARSFGRSRLPGLLDHAHFCLLRFSKVIAYCQTTLLQELDLLADGRSHRPEQAQREVVGSVGGLCREKGPAAPRSVELEAKGCA